ASSTGTSCESLDSPPRSSARSAWTLVCASDSTPRTSETFYDAPSTSTAASTDKPSMPSLSWCSRPPRNRSTDGRSDGRLRSRWLAHRRCGRADLIATRQGAQGISPPRGTVQRCCDPSARRWLAVAWWSVADIVLVGGSVLWPCSVGSRRIRRVRLRDSFITGFVATAWLVQVDGEVQLGHRGRHLAGGSLEWAIDQLQLVSSHRPGEALSRGVDQFHLFGHLAGGSLERGVDQPQLVGSHLPGETLHWTINQCCLSGGGLESELVG